MKLLAFESAVVPGSVALCDGDTVVYHAALPAERRTSESFAMEIQRGLHSVGWHARDLELIAVSHGPGSFTGLRISITAAKTLAYAVGAAVLAVDTLELLAAQTPPGADSVWVTLDAQRRQLFVAQFDLCGGVPVRCTPNQIVDAQTFLQGLGPDSLVSGCGLAKWQLELPTHVRSTPESCWTPDAVALAKLARRRHATGQCDDLWTLVPEYGRASAAEEKRNAP